MGFGLAAGILLAVIAWQVYQLRDSCMNILSGGSCPTMADVAGVRYYVSTGMDLVDIEDSLTPYSQITQSNVPQQFAESTAYAIAGIDPGVLLVARSSEEFDPGDGAYRLLRTADGDSSVVYPALCRHLPQFRREAQPECNT